MSRKKENSNRLLSASAVHSTQQIQVRDRSGTEISTGKTTNRPLSTIIHKDFLVALDQKIGPNQREKISKQVSDTHTIMENLSTDSIKKRTMHRRTSSTGVPKERVKIRQQTDVNDSQALKNRRSANFGKSKKSILEKLKSRTSVETTQDRMKILKCGEIDKDKVLLSQFLLRSSLSLMGYSSEDIAQIDNHILLNYVPSNSKNLPFEKIISKMQLKLSEYNGTQNQHVHATKIQSVFRGWKVRKNLHELLSMKDKNEIQTNLFY